MSKRNKILVTGPPKIGTFDVVEGIITASGQTIPNHLIPKDKTEPIAGLIIPWKIDNKYYTANVDFWLDEPEIETRKETIKEFTRKENGVVDVIDAFIYVFKKDDINGFEGIKEWLDFLDQCEPSIKICILLPTSKEKDGSTTSNNNYNNNDNNNNKWEEMEDWCLDHQFDYVDMELQAESSLDKVGHDIIVDVLHTNMWDGLTRKDGKQANKNITLQHDTSDFDNDDLNDIINEDWYKEIEKLKLDDKNIDIKSDSYGVDILDFEDGGEDNDDDFDLPSKDEIENMHKQLFGEIDQEDGLDKAFQSLQAMREKSKGLPDAERRRMAAQVALSFAAQLGI